jgi:uncharacterized RDD family membrane protein YckC
MSDLVTGDAVVLELRLAKLPSRMLAFLVDLAVQAAALVVLLVLAATGVLAVDEQLGAVVVLLVLVATLVGYPVTVETLSRGRSVGKLALGLRVVRDDGGPIRFRHALTRGLAGFFVDFWALGLGGAVAMIVSLASARGKRVGDYLAGTVVVRERAPAEESMPPDMPPALAAWAAAQDLSRLPDGLVLAVRQYLARHDRLAPASRDAIGRTLASDVAAFLGAPPPWGVPTWSYLSAVLAERRRRAERAHAPLGPYHPTTDTPPLPYRPAPYAPPPAAGGRDEPPTPPAGNRFVPPT